MFMVCGATDTLNNGKEDSLPLRLGLGIGGIVFALCPYTGAGLNAARALPPAVFLNYWDWQWLYEVAPTLGEIFAAVFYRFVLDGNEQYSLHALLSKKMKY